MQLPSDWLWALLDFVLRAQSPRFCFWSFELIWMQLNQFELIWMQLNQVKLSQLVREDGKKHVFWRVFCPFFAFSPIVCT